MGRVKFVGIRSEEVLDCGCILKRYISGLNVIDDPVCKELAHEHFKEHECRTCGEKFSSHNLLKKHRWTHAI